MVKEIDRSTGADVQSATGGFKDDFRGYVKNRLLEVEYIMITPSPKIVFNSGVVTSFSDSFEPQWSEQTSVGRMDSLGTYKTTLRKISTGMLLIAEDRGVAERNLAQASQLARFTYPSYNTGKSSTSNPAGMQGPFVKLRLMNWISDDQTGDGLQGYLLNVSINFDLNEGVYFSGSPEQAFPKYINLDFQFNIVHTNGLGYSDRNWKDNRESFVSFPYGIMEKRGSTSNELASELQATPGSSDKDEQVKKAADDAQNGEPDVLKNVNGYY